MLYVLGFLANFPDELAAFFFRLNDIEELRAVWRSESQEGTRMPATAVTATATQATGDASEVDTVVPITDFGEVENTEMTAIAGPSQISVRSSASTSLTTIDKRVTKVKGGLYLRIIIQLIRLGLSSTFLVLDILYHPKTRPSLSFYHSFALWFSLLGRVEYLTATSGKRLFLWLYHYDERERQKGPQSRWNRLAARFRRDKSNEPRSRDSSRAGSNRASAV